MATHGTVGEFNSTREDWVSYIGRLDQYFVDGELSSSAVAVLPHIN